MTAIVAVDLGTSKLCALAADAGGTVFQAVPSPQPERLCHQPERLCHDILAVRSAPNDADLPDLPAGRHEQDPDRIVETALDLIRDLLGDEAVDPRSVVAIAISTQMHGVLLADARLRAVTNLITWRDQRTAAGIDDLARRLGPDMPGRTGTPMRTGYGAATLGWLAGSMAIPAGTVALGMGDYLAAVLTGVAATDPTQAAGWGILDLARGQWEARACDVLGIDRSLLPRILATGRPMGRLLPARAAALGLGAGVTVASPVGDNQAAVVGAGGLAGTAITVNIGTGGQVSIPREHMEYCPPLETRPMPFGGFILVGASLCGGWAYAYLNRFFRLVASELTGRAVSEADAYERMNALAAEAGPGAGGIRADTRFGGTRTDPDVRGAVEGIAVDNLTPGALARAFLEGEVRELADMVAGVDTAGIGEVVAAGNAVRNNPLMTSLIADAFALPCRAAPVPEEAAVGAARIAAAALASRRDPPANRAP